MHVDRDLGNFRIGCVLRQAVRPVRGLSIPRVLRNLFGRLHDIRSEYVPRAYVSETYPLLLISY